MNHRFEHFGCGYNSFTEKAAFTYQFLLGCRELFKGDFNSEVASCDHNSITFLAYFFDILNTRAIFDFCDNIDIRAAVLV
jgi:hypothetical protein